MLSLQTFTGRHHDWKCFKFGYNKSFTCCKPDKTGLEETGLFFGSWWECIRVRQSKQKLTVYLLALDCVFLLFCRHHINDIFVFPLHSRWANPGWHWARGEERFNWLPDHHMADTWGQTTIPVPVPVHADKQFRVTNEPAHLWIVRWSQSTCRTPTQRWGQHANCFLQISPGEDSVIPNGS